MCNVNKNITKTIFQTIILFVLGGISFANAQGFDMPEEGKSNVYFVRVSGFGGVYTFEYFDNDKYVGAFKGKGYLILLLSDKKSINK